jgi:hypothetical protein
LIRRDKLAIRRFIRDLPPVAEFRLGPGCDVAFRGGNVPPNVLFFSTAWEMVSNVFDAGKALALSRQCSPNHRDDFARPISYYS